MSAPTTGFDEVEFSFSLTDLTGGTMKPTRIVEMPSGREQRIKLWSRNRRRWTGTLIAETPTVVEAARDFWEARDGPARGFRFQDPGEYQVTNEPLAPTGTPTVQLIKTYSSGSINRVQEIYKITTSPAATLRKNGGAFGGFTLDVNTGLVTLTAVISKAITAITKASSAVVTVGAAHGFAVNDLVYISGVVGMTEINARVGTVSATAATTITLSGVNSTAFSTYVSGGTAVKYLTTTDTLDWTGDFRWPVRFGMQQQELDASPGPFAREWQIELQELTG